MDPGSLLSHSAASSPLKAPVICDDQIVSYEALDWSTDALARWLLREGLRTGDRVAIHWCNSVEVVNLYFACFKTGLIAVPVNNRLKAPEIAYILLWACDSVHHLSGQNLAKGRSSRGVLSGEKAHR